MRTYACDHFEPFWEGREIQCGRCNMHMTIEKNDHLLPSAMLVHINDPKSPFNGYVEEFKIACPRCGTLASLKVRYSTKEETQNANHGKP